MNIKSSNNTRLAICISILIITCTIILDRLIPEGIFLDGITYAAISRNLAMGKGTFWALYYRGDWGFNEHPPLMFGIQAIFFKIFGDHYLTEKTYCFAIWIATVFLLYKLWDKEKVTAKYSYALPVLMWCIIPTITWGYTNNILDCTMAMFDLAAVLVIYSRASKHRGIPFINLAIGGLLIFAALLTKGPVGAFPLTIPGIYWLIYNNNSGRALGKAVLSTLFLFAVVAGCYVLLYQFPAPRANFEKYINEQVMAALGGGREITGGSMGRFALLFDLLKETLVPMALGLIIFIVAKIGKVHIVKPVGLNKRAIFFLLVGLCASLPIIMSVKQRTFYLVPSLPYFVLAIATIVYPYYDGITEKWQVGKGLKYFRITAVTLSLALCAYLGTKVGQVGRDHQLISNIKYIKTQFPEGQMLGICPQANNDYTFLAYLQRYNHMEVDPIFFNTDYVLVDKNVCNNNILPIVSELGFKQQPFGLEQYVLYKKSFPLKLRFTLLNPVYRKEDK